MFKPVHLLPLLGLAACATPTAPSGLLSSYEGLAPRDGSLRASVAVRRDEAALAAVKRVALNPVQFAPGEGSAWLAERERGLLLRELDAQLCFEMSERFVIAATADTADAQVRTFVSAVRPTGRAASAVSAASSFFIPGPLGLRAPGSLGGLAAEAEMLDRSDRQLAAVTWSRSATAVGSDSPSLSRIGDALQFAEPFADTVAEVMTPSGTTAGAAPKPDPCVEYGPRIRPEGFLTKFATGLYVPRMSGARAEEPAAGGQAPGSDLAPRP